MSDGASGHRPGGHRTSMENNVIGNKDEQERLHSAFYRFAEICRRLDYGVIEKIQIHAGLPVFLEIEVGTALIAKVKQKHKLIDPE